MPRTDGGVLMPKLWRMSIIDPFEYTHDLGVVLSESGMAALMRELRRAAHVLSPTQPEVKSQTNTLGKWLRTKVARDVFGEDLAMEMG